MKPRHQVSRAAIDLIRRFEGFRERAARLPDGRWTLGHGHTKTARDGAWVSERDAEALLRYDLIAVAETVNAQVFTPLTQNQFDALCAFAFNIGLPAFRSSAVLQLINEGQLLQAACALELWRKADFDGERIVVDALVRRRAAEKALFLTPPDGFVAAPTPLLVPHVDADGLGLVPAEAPAVIRASLDGEAAALTREPPPPPPPRADSEPPPEAVAAALAQRLARTFPTQAGETMFPPQAAPTLPDPEAGPEPEPSAEPRLHAEPAEEIQPSAEAEAAPEADANGMKAFVLSPPAEEPVDAPRVEPVTAPAPAKAVPAWRSQVAGLSALAALGALLLGGGLYWMFNGGAAGAGAPSQTAVGWVVGVAGVLMAGAAFYVLLEILGRGDEEPDALEG